MLKLALLFRRLGQVRDLPVRLLLDVPNLDAGGLAGSHVADHGAGEWRMKRDDLKVVQKYNSYPMIESWFKSDQTVSSVDYNKPYRTQ